MVADSRGDVLHACPSVVPAVEDATTTWPEVDRPFCPLMVVVVGRGVPVAFRLCVRRHLELWIVLSLDVEPAGLRPYGTTDPERIDRLFLVVAVVKLLRGVS